MLMSCQVSIVKKCHDYFPPFISLPACETLQASCYSTAISIENIFLLVSPLLTFMAKIRHGDVQWRKHLDSLFITWVRSIQAASSQESTRNHYNVNRFNFKLSSQHILLKSPYIFLCNSLPRAALGSRAGRKLL